MNKRRKMSISFLLLCVVLLFCSCGRSSQEVYVDPTMQATEQPAIDYSGIADSELFENKVQVGADILEFPCNVSHLLDAGVAFTSTDLSEDYILDGNSEKKINFTYGSTTFSANIINETNSLQKIRNCTVTDIVDISGSDIVFPGQITIGVSTLDDLIATWGDYTYQDNQNASSSSFKVHYAEEYVEKKELMAFAKNGANIADYSDLGTTNYSVVIDRNTNIIQSVSVIYRPHYGSDIFNVLSISDGKNDVSFNTLKDLKLLSSNTETPYVAYAAEKVDEHECLIGIGILSDISIEAFSEQMQVKPDTIKKLLCYGNYDFTQDYQVINTADGGTDYMGGTYQDGMYVSIHTVMYGDRGVQLIFFLNSLNDEITDNMIAYMNNLECEMRNSIELKVNGSY